MPSLPAHADLPLSSPASTWARIGVIAGGIAAMLPMLGAAPRVAIRGNADPTYAEERASREKPAETYVFYPGKFFPGHIPDRTLERLPFVDIAQGLAPHLARQHYLPAGSIHEADLVLVVHWGVTMGYDRAAALFTQSLDSQTRAVEARETLEARIGETAGGAYAALDPLVISARTQFNDSVGDVGTESAAAFGRMNRDLAVTSNAGLLGIGDLIHEASQSAVISTSYQTMDAMLDEDRYFVVVMAYDRKALVDRKTLVRRWSTRLSIRAPGRNFRSALLHLGTAGGEVFGQQTVGLIIERPRLRQTQVDIGEAVVVGPEDADRPKP